MESEAFTAFECFCCKKVFPWPVYIPLQHGAKTYDDFLQSYGLVCPLCVKNKT